MEVIQNVYSEILPLLSQAPTSHVFQGGPAFYSHNPKIKQTLLLAATMQNSTLWKIAS